MDEVFRIKVYTEDGVKKAKHLNSCANCDCYMILSKFYDENNQEVIIEDDFYDYDLFKKGLCYDGVHSMLGLSDKGKEYFGVYFD